MIRNTDERHTADRFSARSNHDYLSPISPDHPFEHFRRAVVNNQGNLALQHLYLQILRMQEEIDELRGETIRSEIPTPKIKSTPARPKKTTVVGTESDVEKGE